MHNEIIKCQEMTKYKYLGEKSELEIWSLQIFSFQRNSTSQLQYDVKTLTIEENLLCLSKLVTEACVKEKYLSAIEQQVQTFYNESNFIKSVFAKNILTNMENFLNIVCLGDIIEKTNPDELDIHFIIYFSQLWRFK